MKETSAFINKIGEALLLDVQDVIEEEEAKTYESIERRASLGKDSDLSLRFATITDSNYAIALNRFLTHELGWNPTVAIIVDPVPEEYKNTIENYLYLKQGFSPNIVPESDLNRIWKWIEYESPDLLLGRSLDKYIAEKVNTKRLSVSYPLTDRVIINRGYAGYLGTINLIEDLLSQMIAS